MERIKALLSEKYGYTQFRNGQEEIIQKVLQKQNVLGIMPTGSHVKKTTDQLNCLKELDGQVDFMEFQVNTVFEENGLEKEVEKTVKAAEEKILSGSCKLPSTK